MMEASISSLQRDIRELTAGVQALRSALEAGVMPASPGRKLKRSDVCRLLAICHRTLCKYYEVYQLPIANPHDRNSRYSYEEVRAAAEILRKHGKLKRGTVFNI